MLGNTSITRWVVRAGVCGALVWVAASASAAAAIAAPPSETVLQVGKARMAADLAPNNWRQTADCPLGEVRFQLYTTTGTGYGTMKICYLRSLSDAYYDAFSTVVTLNIPGGTIVARPGWSLAESGYPRFTASGDWCHQYYAFGAPDMWLAWFASCSGVFVDGTGIWAGVQGRLTFEYGWIQPDPDPASFFWQRVPTLTLTVEPTTP